MSGGSREAGWWKQFILEVLCFSYLVQTAGMIVKRYVLSTTRTTHAKSLWHSGASLTLSGPLLFTTTLLLVYDTTGLHLPQLHEHDSQCAIALVATSLTNLTVNVRLRPCRHPPTVNVLQIRALI